MSTPAFNSASSHDNNDLIPIDEVGDGSHHGHESNPSRPSGAPTLTTIAAPFERRLEEPMTKKAKKASEIWHYFTPKSVGKKSEDDGRSIIESRSKAQVSKDSRHGTTQISGHFSVCRSKPNIDEKEQFLSTAFGSSNSTIVHKFDHKKCREALAKMIILHEHPFDIVTQQGFIEYCRTLQPQFKMVSCNTVKSDCLEIYKQEKCKLSKVFDGFTSRISLTADMWTSMQIIGYMAITAHYIDSDWNLQKRIINFVNVDSPHPGVVLAETIKSNLMKWKIDDKIFCLTLDDCSINDHIVTMLKNHLTESDGLLLSGNLFHIHCTAHIFKLIVQDGLREIPSITQKIRDTITFIKNSTLSLHKFRELVAELGLNTSKGLPLDDSTRWDSTYLMLESALYFRKAFSRLQVENSNYSIIPSDYDWDRVAVVIDFLKGVYEATIKLSGSKFPTINLFLREVIKIQSKLVEKLNDDDSFSRNMARTMKENFDKYLLNYNKIFEIAILLDPSRKLLYLEYVFTKLYGLHDYIIMRKNEALNLFRNIYEEYCMRVDRTLRAQNVYKVDVTNRLLPSDDDDFTMFEEYCMSQERVVKQKTELDRYLDDRRERSLTLDVLDWWKRNSSEYPILSSMACDILAIPVFTVDSKLAFSTGGRVLDQYKSCLKSEIVEALVCAQDWIRAEQYCDNDVLDDDLLDILKEE